MSREDPKVDMRVPLTASNGVAFTVETGSIVGDPYRGRGGLLAGLA